MFKYKITNNLPNSIVECVSTGEVESDDINKKMLNSIIHENSDFILELINLSGLVGKEQISLSDEDIQYINSFFGD